MRVFINSQIAKKGNTDSVKCAMENDAFGSIPDDSMLRKCFCKRLLTKRKRRGCKYGREV